MTGGPEELQRKLLPIGGQGSLLLPVTAPHLDEHRDQRDENDQRTNGRMDLSIWSGPPTASMIFWDTTTLGGTSWRDLDT